MQPFKFLSHMGANSGHEHKSNKQKHQNIMKILLSLLFWRLVYPKMKINP